MSSDPARRPTPALGTLIVIAKEPLPGRVKTRLVPPLNYREAASVAEAALVDTLVAMRQVPAGRYLLALDGRPGGWLRRGWEVIAQCDGGLDQRLAGAFDAADPGAPALLVGMDTPQLQPGHLGSAQLEFAADAYLGPARDGGYWALGLREPGRASEVLVGVPMSQADTARHQLDRLRAGKMQVQLLGELTDVDTVEDARTVATEAPRSRFAAAWRAVDQVAADA